MDLALYLRVLRRFRLLVAVGFTLAVVLAIYSYYKVTFHNGTPTLTNRKAEVWQTPATIFLGSTQPAQTYTNPGRFISLAPLYAQFANADPVRKETLRRCGRFGGGYTALPFADTSYGVTNGLPMVSIIGTGPSPKASAGVARCATSAFMAYIQNQQISSGVPVSQRVQMSVVKAPDVSEATPVVPRKKTLPIVVFLAVLFATIALALVLENARPSVRVLTSPPDVRDVRRSA